MVGPKQRLIETRLGESLESFLTKRIAAGQGPTSIGRELDLDHSTIRYWIKKYNIPYQAGKPRLRFPPDRKDTEAPKLRLKGEHVDICLCPLCAKDCERKEIIHKAGRCVFFCANFSRKAKEIEQKEIERIKLSNTSELVAYLVDGKMLDLRIWVEGENYKGWIKQSLRFYLFDENWEQFKELMGKVDKKYEELA